MWKFLQTKEGLYGERALQGADEEQRLAYESIATRVLKSTKLPANIFTPINASRLVPHSPFFPHT